MKRLLLIACVIGCSAIPLRAAEQPNILFCFADDWGRYAGAYAALDGRHSANQVVRTPNIDRVAREGALFRNAFVNAPSLGVRNPLIIRP